MHKPSPFGRDLDDLPQMLLCAQEEERRRIASDLHDGIGQCLSAVRFGIEGLKQHLGERLGCDDQAKFDCLAGLITQAIEEVRRISTGLRPPMLDDLGVVSAIDWFCAELRKVFTDIEVVQSVRADEHAIRPPVKVAIFRILQEACSNACKHSGARRLSVLLETDAEGVRLEVADDGIGFNPGPVRRSFTGLGLASMRERATLTNGCLAIRSQPGAGTRILAAWCGEDIRAACPHEDFDPKGNLVAVAATCAGGVLSPARTANTWDG